MSSLLTNLSALSALQSLSMTQKNLATVQSQISSGLRVQGPSDNAAYWSISTTMKSDTGALSAVTDALSLGASTVSVATSALTSSISVMNAIKQDLITAAEPGVDLTKVQSDITAQQAQLRSIAAAASFNGQNFLSANSTASTYIQTANIVASFSRDASNNITVGTIAVDTSTINLYDPAGTATAGTSNTSATGILDKVDTSSTYTTGGTNVSIDSMSLTSSTFTALTPTNQVSMISAYTSQVDAAIQSMTAAATSLGATTTKINLQSSFVSSLSTAITEGVGSLIDADMNEASTKLNALQTQQQLGVQSLGIANQNAQLILKLFGA